MVPNVPFFCVPSYSENFQYLECFQSSRNVLNVKYKLQLLTHNNRLIIQLYLGSEVGSFEDRQPKKFDIFRRKSSPDPIRFPTLDVYKIHRDFGYFPTSSCRCAVVERIGYPRHDLRVQKHHHWLVLPSFYKEYFPEAPQSLSRGLGRSLKVTKFRKIAQSLVGP